MLSKFMFYVCFGRNQSILVFALTQQIELNPASNGKTFYRRLTCFYGHPITHKIVQTWKLLQRIHNQDGSPWLVGRDLNAILWNHEMSSQHTDDDHLISNFRETLDSYSLMDMSIMGNKYTCCNNRHLEGQQWRQLNRLVCNTTFKSLFPNAKVLHLDCSKSDHRAIAVNLQPSAVLTRGKGHIRRFKFD